MKRIKRHKVKSEAPETSTSYNREHEIHDLAYYIHDRVELMHQVFSVIKYKELKAMVPASIRNISLDDLQELCTEELLGISSKRLCAILDGADPPSDTESSSPSPPPELETISLDSISSDDEILSQTSNKKKKHKHRRHSKSKPKRKKSKDGDEGEADKSKASRAGLTVLELLELQARARAIRAQLQQEQQNKPAAEETTTKEPSNSSDNEVEIKEEPPEVVEISSDEEKPKVEELQKKIIEEKEASAPQQASPPATVTKRINDLVITVPQKTKQKIKLNRNKSIPAAADKPTSIATTQKATDTPSVETPKIAKPTENKNVDSKITKKDKSKKRKKDKKNVSKDDIDNDEITLQLSDTEKMDLLEDLDRKHYDSVSSESNSESSSDSDVSVKEKNNKDSGLKDDDGGTTAKVALEAVEIPLRPAKVARVTEKKSEADNNKNKEEAKATSELVTEDITNKTEPKSSDIDITEETKEVITESDKIVHTNRNIEIVEINLETQSEIVEKTDSNTTSKDTVAENSGVAIQDTPAAATKDKDNEEKETQNNLSEGELSDRESSEIEAVDFKPEVVCISDEEGGKKAKKKKKKKEKKSKKDKKSKKKSDFLESADQNFFKDNLEMENSSQDSKEAIYNTTQSDAPHLITKTIDEVPTEIIDKIDLTAETTSDNDIKPIKEELLIDNDVKIQKEIPAALSDSDTEAVYEIMELSDDSSCCEVECTTTLSKEPTASEIEALSAKIDEIQRVDIITDKEIRDYERGQEKADIGDVEHVSWKDRYLESKKVKKVLTTANIFNALRKKNIELKKKLAESKMETEEAVPEEKEAQEEKEAPENVLEEGSIEHYNTLEALTTYVDPVKVVTKDLKKDAKLLLKMYKKLLKYNDMNKPEDPNKKRKKRKKKIKKDTMHTEEGKDTMHTEEGKDTMHTEEGKDTMHTEEGKDTMHTEEGKDTMHTEEGKDTMHTEEGKDTMHTEEGKDTMHTEEGKDTMHTEEGKDTMHTEEGKDTMHTEEGKDTMHTEEVKDTGVVVENVSVENKDVSVGIGEEEGIMD